jgi:AAA15 family ATPase/GTPase
MKISKLEIINFKRFTNLSISGIPESSRLILLIGANGSGKSSIFDGFDWLSKGIFKGVPTENSYYRKDPSKESTIFLEFSDSIQLRKIDITLFGPRELVKRFIGRSSIRIVPRISNQSDVSSVSTDNDSPSTYIDNDVRFLNDINLYINQIDMALREPVFRGEQVDVLKIFQDLIKPLNDSLINIFGGDQTTQLQIAQFENSTSSSPAKLIFKKGQSKINYELLSHGEKQVIILLLNFIVRKKFYENTIIFIDEMDCHLNTSLQYNLLNEIVTKWIPHNSQLWTASHALGFIDYARKSKEASVIDLDQLNFDEPQVVVPQSKESLELYEIAVPKNLLFDILKGKRVIFCENQNDEYYQLLNIKDCLFVGLDGSREVFLQIKRDKNSYALRDRDYLMSSEIQKLKNLYPNLYILNYYNFENYLYHPENIAELNLDSFDKPAYIQEIRKHKEGKYESVLLNLKATRNNYEEFKTDEIKSKNEDEITQSLKSEDFETFYKFFDMKKFNKTYLEKFNISKATLSQTSWFKKKIEEIVGKG